MSDNKICGFKRKYTRYYTYWKCQVCGLSYEKLGNLESRRCPVCYDKGVKTYLGKFKITKDNTKVWIEKNTRTGGK